MQSENERERLMISLARNTVCTASVSNSRSGALKPGGFTFSLSPPPSIMSYGHAVV